MMFKDRADVSRRLGKEQYISSDEIATVIYLAILAVLLYFVKQRIWAKVEH